MGDEVLVHGRCAARDCIGDNDPAQPLFAGIPGNTVLFENGRLFRFLDDGKGGGPTYVEELRLVISPAVLAQIFSDADNTLGGEAAVLKTPEGRLQWEF